MKATIKDIVRTIKKEHRRLLGFAVITALGVTMTGGLRAACDDLRASAEDFYDMQNMHDMEVVSTLGLTDDDIVALRNVQGVENVQGVYAEAVLIDMPDSDAGASVSTFVPNGIDDPYITEGRFPERVNEALVQKDYLDASGKKVGDTFRITETIKESEEIDSEYDELRELNEGEKPSFVNTEFVITGVFNDVNATINPEGPTATFRLRATENYSIFVLPEAVDSDIYTSIKVTVAGAEDEYSFGEEYENRIAGVKNYIEKQVKPDREKVRSESVSKEAQDKVDKARNKLNEVFAEAEEELADARKKLDEGREELEKSTRELNNNEAKLNREIADGRNEIAAGRAELAKNEEILNAKNEEALKSKNELETNITAAETQLNELIAQKNEMEAAGYPVPEELLAGIAEAEASIEMLKGYLAEAEAGLQVIAAGRQEIAAGYADLAAGEAELNNAEANGRKQIASGRNKLNDALTELDDGEKEYAENAAEYEKKKAEAMEELDDADQKVKDIASSVWYVRDRHAVDSYECLVGDAECIQSIGTIFPILFLAIAVLISLTTITRMVEEDRGLIGTYKAMGFTNKEIRRKYVSFSALACLIGGILGNILGVYVLPNIIFVIFTQMYLFPSVKILSDFRLCLLGTAIFFVTILATTLIISNKTLKEMPAQLMRPKAPEKGTRIILERIKPIWKKMSFLNKVTARNLFRYKKRMLMTIFGIMGCTGLLVCGFSIKDTVANLTARQFGHVINYDILAVNKDRDDNKTMMKYIDEEDIYESSQRIKVESIDIVADKGDTMTVQVFVIEDPEEFTGYMGIADADGNPVTIDDSSIVITRNAGKILGFTKGDQVMLRSIKLTEADVKVSAVAENYLGNYVFMTKNMYGRLFEEYQPNAALIKLAEGSDPYKAADTLEERDEVMTVSSVQRLIDGFNGAFILINMVVYVVIVMAAALAFVVLFTLSATNISERQREIATIKVLGFQDREVHTYVNKETVILTVIGIIPGLVLGKFLGIMLINALNLTGVNFYVVTNPISYVLSFITSFLFMLIVNIITNFTLNKIDPIEALKSIE